MSMQLERGTRSEEASGTIGGASSSSMAIASSEAAGASTAVSYTQLTLPTTPYV